MTRSEKDRQYRRTKKGFLVKTYYNIQKRARVRGFECLSREEFYKFGLESATFLTLFKLWRETGCTRKLTPSLDRIDRTKGYSLDNIQWLSVSDNSKKWHREVNKKKNYKITILIEET